MLRENKIPGSSVLEVIVLISVISLISVVAIPSYLSYRENKKANCISQKFRTFAAAIHHYSDVHGDWPEDQEMGIIPPGLESELQEFEEPSLIGGHWDWDYAPGSEGPSICLVDPKSEGELILRVDQILDDGNITSGALVYSGKRLVLSLQP